MHLAAASAVGVIWRDMNTATPPKRRRASAEERSRVVCLFRESGLTQAQFAQQHGIKLHTLQRWIYRPGPKRPSKIRFQELPATSFLSASWAAEVIPGTDATLRFSADARPEFIGLLIEKLRRAPSDWKRGPSAGLPGKGPAALCARRR